MIAETAGLLWLSLRGLKLEGTHEGESVVDLIWNAWLRADKWYMVLMASILLISHILRAERWRMLLEPSGHKSNSIK